MELSDEDVARHEVGHWVVGVVNGFAMGYLIMIPSAAGGFSGRAGYRDSFAELTSNERRRAAIRTCLAGEVSRGVRSLGDFSDGAASDLEAARTFAAEVDDNGDVDDVLREEFERTVDEVVAHESEVQAVVDRLLATESTEGGYRSLTGIAAAKAMGWRPIRNGDGNVVSYEAVPA
jgi:hypothetical protein